MLKRQFYAHGCAAAVPGTSLKENNGRMRLMKRFVLVWVCSGMMLAGVIGGASPAAAQTPAEPAGFTGIWKGTLRVTPCGMMQRDRNRCGAVNNITFTIVQDGSNVSGHYTCAIGTAMCRNGNDAKSGKITSGTANGKNIRFSVLVPSDVSNCNYSGHSPSSGQMRGGYSCYQGGGLVEQGMFEVTRLGD
jgi:hypothetical protein